MKKLILMLTITLMSAPATIAARPHKAHKSESKIMSPEQTAALSPLQYYIQAHESGNGDFIRRAFDKDAKVTGYMGGKLIAWSVEEYAARFSGKPAADEAQRKRSIEILDLTADAAVGKVVLDYPAVKFTDYMSLLKIDGVWKIANKSFHAEMKPATK